MSGERIPLGAACRAAIEELSSAADLVRWGASRFGEYDLVFGHGTDNAIDEALELVLHGLGFEPGLPDALLAARLTRAERERCVALLRRRIVERVPAPYITRRAWFAGLRLYVDERVLVPRSPLAEWIERGFEPWLEPGAVRRVLDLGTGSGCLAIACALAFPEAEVDAVESSAAARAVAARNVAEHGLEARVQVRAGDLYDGARERYALILSNPPYVAESSLAALPPEYRHEPRAALAAGADGLDCVRRILAGAPDCLEPGGVLVVEVGEARAAFEAAYPELPVVWLDCERGGADVALLGAAALGGGG